MNSSLPFFFTRLCSEREADDDTEKWMAILTVGRLPAQASPEH
jgi:hypothetical protein